MYTSGHKPEIKLGGSEMSKEHGLEGMELKKQVVMDLLESLNMDPFDAKRIAINVANLLREQEEEAKGKALSGKLREAEEEREDESISLLDGSKKRLSKKELKRLRRLEKKRKAQRELEESEDEDSDKNEGEDNESEELDSSEPEDEKGTTKKTKGKKGSHLIPKEKVIVPEKLLKHKQLGPLLKLHMAGGSDGKKGRIGLRKLGFKLSDESTWKKFMK